MITREEISSLPGWKQSGAMANGGTLLFSKDGKYVLHYNGDNFIFKGKKDPKLTEIKIKMIFVVYDETTKSKRSIDEAELYKGHPANIKELKEILRILLV